MKTTDLCVATFIVTALWDVLLRAMSLRWERLPEVIKTTFPFIGYLTEYFQRHTLLAAALLAGFIGATTQWIIVSAVMMPWPHTTKKIPQFLLVSFVVSALYGFLMKLSGLFPVLEETYYRRLEEDGGMLRSMYHDGISGLIVQVTLLVLIYAAKSASAV